MREPGEDGHFFAVASQGAPLDPVCKARPRAGQGAGRTVGPAPDNRVPPGRLSPVGPPRGRAYHPLYVNEGTTPQNHLEKKARQEMFSSAVQIPIIFDGPPAGKRGTGTFCRTLHKGCLSPFSPRA